jgi:hypothetical protein
MLAPIRPNRPFPVALVIVFSYVDFYDWVLVSFSGEIILFPCGRYGLSQKLRRTPYGAGQFPPPRLPFWSSWLER